MMARLRRPSLILIILCAAVSLCQCFPSVSQSLARSRQQPLPTRRQKVKSTSPDSGSEKDGSSTVTSSIFNLVKGIVGAGVLSLPAGVAAFGNAPSALIPAVGLITVMGSMSAYTFGLLGRICSETGASSYREAWDRTIGEKSSLIPAISVTALTMFAALAYSMILADTFQSLFVTVGWNGMTRTKSLLSMTSFLLLPLCWMKNLNSLAPFSLLGTLGMALTTVFMAIRYFQKAYLPIAGKAARFLVSKELAPSFGSIGIKGALSPNSFILISMLSTAYLAHFNAAKFYTDQQGDKTEKIARFNKVVSISFAVSIAIFCAITSIGYLSFGASSNGFILNNYSTKDSLMSVSRIAVALSLVFSYPLVFVGVREGLLDLLQKKERTNQIQNVLTVAGLSAITSAALVVKDVSFILAIAGATLGNALIYVYPALMFRAMVSKKSNASNAIKRESRSVLSLAFLGVIFGIIGAGMAVKSVI